MEAPIKKKLDEYLEARREHERAKSLASEADRKVRSLEQSLVDAMVEGGVPKFSLDNGLTVSLRKRFDCAVNQENGTMVEEWLQEFTGDVTQFQKLVLYKPAVVSFLRDGIEEGKIDETSVPSFMNLRTTPGITVRGLSGLTED